MVTTRRGKRKSMDAFPIIEPQELPSSVSQRQKLPLRKKRRSSAAADIDIALELDAALQEDVATQTPPTPVVKRQDAEESPEVTTDDGEEVDDSDDEAPEAVSNVLAASRAREAAEAVMKAAKEETDKLRQKRKERDARLKEQAQSRKAKRDTQPEPEPEVQDPAAEAAVPSPAEPTPRFGRVEIPTLLPAEFLDSDSEAEAEDGDEQAPKRRKAEVQKSREPRDKRVGGAVYRVMRQADVRMAPKGEGRSKRVRTGLTKRGRDGARKATGFLVGGKRRVDWGTSRR